MVLLVCAVVLAVGSGVLLRSISVVNQSADEEHSLVAWAAVNACGEYALGQMATTADSRLGWAYPGNEEVSIAGNPCYIYSIVAGLAAGSKLIEASSTVSNFTKKLEIEVATNTPSVVINYWKEVADF